MNIVPYKAEHLATLQLQRGQEHCGFAVDAKYAKDLEGQYAFTAMVGDKPIAVGGVTQLWEDRALVWTFIDRQAGPYFTQLHKVVKDILDYVPYRRLEADTPCEFEPGHRWLKMLGFELEAPRMKAYRIDGGDSALYAKVKPWR